MTTLSTINQTLLALRIDEPSMLSIDCASGNVRLLIDELGGTPDGVQVDLERGLVYWTNMGADYHADDGTVEVANLDGSGRRVLVGRGAIRTPKQLCLDRAAGQLYWCDREGAAIWRSDVDGANLTKLVDRAIEPGGRDEVLNQCVGIAVDHKRGMFVWTQKGPAKGGKGRIFRAELAIRPGDSAENRSDIEILLSDLPEPIDVEIDAHNDLLYWTDRGAAPDGNSLNSAKITASGLIGRRVICTGFKEAIGLALDIPNHCAYVADLDGDVVKVDLASGAKETLIKEGRITGIALI
jgi:sugar lactone lactonase YvrE